MAYTLVLAFDIVDENDKSVIGGMWNTNEVEIVNPTSLDITSIWLDMYHYAIRFPEHPGTSHLFPYMAPLIEAVQGGNASGILVDNPLIVCCNRREIGHPLQDRTQRPALPESAQR